jgi:hypothetical protein
MYIVWALGSSALAIDSDKVLKLYPKTESSPNPEVIKIIEENQIEFLVDNHVQVSDIANDKGNLLDFLREKLNNWRIQLKVVIDEAEAKDGDSLYDPSDKFMAMAEKNPLLKDFKNRFDLDIEHD